SVPPLPVTSPPLIPEMHRFTPIGFSTSNQNYRCEILPKNTITGKVATKRNLVEDVVAVQSKKDSIFKPAHKSLIMFDFAFVICEGSMVLVMAKFSFCGACLMENKMKLGGIDGEDEVGVAIVNTR
ncbi:hypothetical protein A2U01_0039906, partial [Trifolium medium]|nr:hypothetical protein [Trifolium medium]